MFQNKNIKRLKNEITEKIPLKQKNMLNFLIIKSLKMVKLHLVFTKKLLV